MPTRLLPPSVLACVLAVSTALATPVDFNRQILPILVENCFTCHGPDADERKAELRLDTHEGALGKGESGDVAVVPGKSAESAVIARILSKDRDEVMPPPKSKHQLTAAQKDLLRRWIDEGAAWGSHWAYDPPKVPAIPEVRMPARTIRNPIDHFVLARLEREGVEPSPEADRRTLLRRLSLDLLGLPPTPEQVQAFLADPRADAYERLVDALLASPHFGERWGRHWLDLARYADSGGYLNDTLRPYAYLYRDWVIDAINRDLPFDQFTIEQLAGDLLPNATLEQKIADRLSPQHAEERRSRRRPRTRPHQGCRRSHRHHRRRVARPHGRLRRVPLAQIRRHLAPRILTSSTPSSMTPRSRNSPRRARTNSPATSANSPRGKRSTRGSQVGV